MSVAVTRGTSFSASESLPSRVTTNKVADQQGCRSADDVFVGCLIEADDQRLAQLERWRTEFATGTNEQGENRGVIGLIALQVEMHNLRAARDVDLIHLTDELQRIRIHERSLASIDLRFDGNVAIGQERGGLAARLATVAVLAPINFGHLRYS